MIVHPPVENKPMISTADFQKVASLLKDMTGIHLTPNKSAMVSGRLGKRMKALNVPSLRSYIDILESADFPQERDYFISALTTNMTRFNREAYHFKHFEETLLPILVRTAQNGNRVRIWSAACSTGEEVYDLASRIVFACPTIAAHDLKILATDIDKAAIKTAELGEYSSAAIQEMPLHLQSVCFAPEKGVSGKVRVADKVRSIVAFKPLNLNGEWPFTGKFELIVCRNVAIYFDPSTCDRLWRRLSQQLSPNGVLYTGHSEALPRDLIDMAIAEGSGVLKFRDTFAAGSKGMVSSGKKEKSSGA